MRILITGGAGFIGKHTAVALENLGHTVRLMDNLDPQIHGPIKGFPKDLEDRFECIQGDIRSPSDIRRSIEGIEAVFHLCAQTGVGQSMYDLSRYFEVNCTGTANLIECIVENKIQLKKLVLASSRAVYGEGNRSCSQCGTFCAKHREVSRMEQGSFEICCPQCGHQSESIPTEESYCGKPNSIYGWTKYMQETLVAYGVRAFGIPSVSLRYFNVYGSEQSLKNPYTGIVTVFFNRIVKNNPVVLYENGVPERDFVHINDIVAANVKALTCSVVSGERINIGSGKPISLQELSALLYQVMDVKPDLKVTSLFRVGDILGCYASVEKAKEKLGFESTVELSAGLKEFCLWAKHHIPQKDLSEEAAESLRKLGLLKKVA